MVAPLAAVCVGAVIVRVLSPVLSDAASPYGPATDATARDATRQLPKPVSIGGNAAVVLDGMAGRVHDLTRNARIGHGHRDLLFRWPRRALAVSSVGAALGPVLCHRLVDIATPLVPPDTVELT